MTEPFNSQFHRCPDWQSERTPRALAKGFTIALTILAAVTILAVLAAISLTARLITAL